MKKLTPNKDKNINNKKHIFIEESISKLLHDFRGKLSVMKMTIDLFKMSDEYKVGGKEIKNFIKNLDDQIVKIVKMTDSK